MMDINYKESKRALKTCQLVKKFVLSNFLFFYFFWHSTHDKLTRRLNQMPFLGGEGGPAGVARWLWHCAAEPKDAG